MDSATLRHADTVKRMAKNGMSQREIARVTDLSLATVNRLVNYDPASDNPNSLEAFALRSCGRVNEGCECGMCAVIRCSRK
jgi:DNA invertase Pin-like site-specific DNA recombinase